MERAMKVYPFLERISVPYLWLFLGSMLIHFGNVLLHRHTGWGSFSILTEMFFESFSAHLFGKAYPGLIGLCVVHFALAWLMVASLRGRLPVLGWLLLFLLVASLLPVISYSQLAI